MRRRRRRRRGFRRRSGGSLGRSGERVVNEAGEEDREESRNTEEGSSLVGRLGGGLIGEEMEEREERGKQTIYI